MFPSRFRHLGLSIACLLLAAGKTPAQQTAHISRGQVHDGRLHGSAADQLRFLTSDAQQFSLTQIRRIEVAPSAPVPICGTLRQFELCGGESVSGQLLGANRTQATLRLFGIRRQIPIGSLESLRMPADRLDIHLEDFETRSSPTAAEAAVPTAPAPGRPGRAAAFPTDNPMKVALPLPHRVRDGRISLCFYDPGSEDRHGGFAISVLFTSPDDSTLAALEISVRGRCCLVDGAAAQAVSVQPLPRTPGWRTVEVSCRTGRLLAAVDGQLLASGAAPAGEMTRIEFARIPEDATSPPENPDDRMIADGNTFYIDDVSVQRYVAARRPKRPDSRRQDVAYLASGDELYGELVQFNSRQLTLESYAGPVTVPWNDMFGVAFRRREISGGIVTGWLSIVELRSPADSEMPDRIIAAVQSADENVLTVSHPFLGELAIPWASVRAVEPQYFGRQQVISPSVRHLGDEIRTRFRNPLPEGTEFHGRFSLESIPPGSTFLAVDVDELEPSGTSTAPGSPFLDELRAGHLATEAEINGQPLGSLNERISFRSSGRPQRIRLPVPPGVLQVGENTFSFKQHPSRSAPARYDDCEIARIALESEPLRTISPSENE